MSEKNFPEDFQWGAATAAFQIEGHPDEYSKKLSDWSKWIDEPGKVLEPSNKGKAVDHWTHMPEDIAQLKTMNCNSYRFSFNWAAMHRGPGDFDQETIDFYKRLLDELEANAVEPYATLVHFVLPEWLAEEGGWQNSKTAYEFENFAKKLAQEFGHRIKNWISHNEPNIFLYFGYECGIWPPGKENDWSGYFKAYQGIVLSHQLAYKAIKSQNVDAQVGFAQNLYDVHTLSQAAGSKEPSWKNSDIVPTTLRAHLHNYAMIENFYDMGCLDFLGINYYTRLIYDFNDQAVDLINPGGKTDLWGQMMDAKVEFPKDVKVNDLNWEIYPKGLHATLTDKKLKRIIGDTPIYITENGYCYVEGASPEGGYSQFTDSHKAAADIQDDYRIEFIKGHLEAVHQAIQDGANVRGYFYWSLLDNFEWAMGMRPRFGLIHVDHESFKRSPKASSKYYAEVCIKNAVI